MSSGNELGIDHLTDLEVIGRGGFSVVYAATDTQFDRRVAVKLLSRLTSDSDRRRFDAECRVMGRLSAHPNVVTVHSAGYTTDERPYLIMELIHGGTLGDRLQGAGRLPWHEALDIVRPIADALGQAHAAGILHRDVKPENILMDGDVPRLTDFGIAYLRDSTGATSTNVTASWYHTAPETFSSTRDERSDIYSLASTAYTLIAGQPPLWRPDDDSLSPLMYRLINEPAPNLGDDLAPPVVDQFLLRCLAKDPDHRPVNTTAFISELDAVRSSAASDAAGTVAAVPASPPPTPGPVPGLTGTDVTQSLPTEAGASHLAPPTDPNAWPAPGQPAAPAATGSTGWDGPGQPAATGPADWTGGHSYSGPGGHEPYGPYGAIAAADQPRRSPWLLAVPIVIVIAMLGAAVVSFALDGDPAGATELVLEPVGSVGQDPFTDPVVPGAPGGPAGAYTGAAADVVAHLNPAVGALGTVDFSGVELPPATDDGTISVAGSAPGLYGGSNEIAVCDRQALIDFLTSDEAKGDAWASVLGITRAEIGEYINGLTDVILQVDTRVTNHGYRNGEPVAIDSVLQAGTAVLIDRNGVPRVRCYCGNPLLEPRPLATSEPDVSGTNWPGADVAAAIIVSAVDPVSEFVLDDMLSDGFLRRVPGSDATDAELISSDDPAAGSTTTSSTSSSTSTTTTTGSSTATSTRGRATTTGDSTTTTEDSTTSTEESTTSEDRTTTSEESTTTSERTTTSRDDQNTTSSTQPSSTFTFSVTTFPTFTILPPPTLG